VLRALPSPPTRRRIYIPAETPLNVAAELRADGWTTLAALSPKENALAEADRLGCVYILEDNKIMKVS
jgi:hypothetical protein